MENKEGTRRPAEGNGPRIGDTPSTLNEEQIQFVTKEEHQSIHAGVDWATGKDKASLLVIELENETAVPKVIYKGEEITGKTRVSFEWDTREESPLIGGTRYNIEHLVKCDKSMVKKGYGLSTGKHMFDSDEQP
ncbi:hypothetical protein GCM10008934_24940 [Virgibacillus salarius]|uniref:hypothetical protein n=1 Tax=Virgibacillus salarius TaxID=447199 RepID=UPI0004061B99|nr:hypothetical protein [Priestia megaterium]